VANTAGERRALIDRELDRLSAGQGGVMYLEIDRAGDEFTVLDRYRGVVRIADDRSVPELVEFMRVGVAVEHGAAEYVRFRLDGDEQTIYATQNPNPTSGQPRVLYDACVPTYFPPNTIVPLETVRQLMLDFALHGEWSHATAWRVHEHMVA
jgi:hypothetical protein